MRVYLPSTLPALAAALRAGEIGPAPATGYAVTPALREWYASGDLEELEYVALMEAARASLRLLAADPGAPARRVVLAGEVPDEQIGRSDDQVHPAAVLVLSPVPMAAVAAGHVDAPDAADDVRAAVTALAAADDGDDDAKFTVDGAEGHELLWYATQELYLLFPGPHLSMRREVPHLQALTAAHHLEPGGDVLQVPVRIDQAVALRDLDEVVDVDPM